MAIERAEGMGINGIYFLSYDQETMCLELQFPRGAKFVCDGVPGWLFREMSSTKSIEKYFIKLEQYRQTRISTE